MAATAPRRRLWLWVVAGVIVIVAAVGVGVFFGSRQSPVVPTVTTSADPTAAGVDGCLGGADRDAATVLAAQAAAPHTTDGAVGYAATFSRWIYQIPTPGDIALVAAENRLTDDVWDAYAQSAADWQGPTPVTATTQTGRFDVGQISEDAVQVTLVLPWVVDGAVSPTRRFVPTLMLEWDQGRWEVTAADGSRAGSDDLASLGTEIQGGC